MTQTSKCSHRDCGWCYAPEGADTNARDGACVNQEECPEYDALITLQMVNSSYLDDEE